jgi:DNA uptake protein ComE-like DNA-binding protein
MMNLRIFFGRLVVSSGIFVLVLLGAPKANIAYATGLDDTLSNAKSSLNSTATKAAGSEYGSAAMGAGASLAAPVATKAVNEKAAIKAKAKAVATKAVQKGAALREKAKASAKRLNINTATVDQLKSLPGVGESNVQKIIDGRPYKAKAELLSKKVVDSSVYKKISGLIEAK